MPPGSVRAAGLERIPVHFDPRMVADARSYSPSAGKPSAVVAAWRALGIPLELRTPRPVDRDQLCAAHHPAYVDGVLAGRIDNGFGNRLPAVAASLPWTSGAMVDAAHAAIDNGIGAVAPVSGFHHAHHDHGGGFCTINGLVVAACDVRRRDPAARVGILDFDTHYGDGTAQILRQLGLHWVVHVTAGADYERPEQAREFLDGIESMVASMRGCAVVLYQAGADPHVDDPLGGWLTSAQLAERDRRVFTAARRFELPVAWNLAGGYQDPIGKVLAIHDATLRACAAAWGVGPAPPSRGVAAL
jgi:acetoin utilization deacetylase AcuC-like enzyme